MEEFNVLRDDESSQWHCPSCNGIRLTRDDSSSNSRGSSGAKRDNGTQKRTAHQKKLQSKKMLPQQVTTVIANINSIKGKKHQLAALIDSAKPHIIILTETKLSNRFSSSEFIDTSRYSVTRRDRDSAGGGVLVAVSNEFDGYEVDMKCESESAFVVLHSKNQPPTLVGAFYRPPDSSIEYLKKFIAELKVAIRVTKPAHLIVGGDYNFPKVS